MGNKQPKDLDCGSLKLIISQVKEIALLILSLVFTISLPTTQSPTLLIFHLVSILLVAIFVIICRLTH